MHLRFIYVRLRLTENNGADRCDWVFEWKWKARLRHIKLEMEISFGINEYWTLFPPLNARYSWKGI